jgi:5-methyltetrahydrofolate--homocysteine methyltransferase
VKKHGGPVIGLVMDEEAIPKTSEGRLRIAEKILTWAVERGISEEEVIIDPLALSAGADQQAVLTILETIRLIARELGVNVTLEASNVSFGVPGREDVNDIILITNLLLERDESAMLDIACYTQGS